MNNLFWPMYQSLEKEFLESSRFVRFDDDNVKTYSNRFIDILLRTWVEIECISKQLFFDNGGTIDHGGDLYFDTDCIEYLNNLWKICDKRINIVNADVYFEKADTKTFKPLLKCNLRGTSGSKWKQAYQSVKHNRIEHYKKANLANCLYSLGALYVLNVYYRDFKLGNISMNDKNEFDSHLGSSLFCSEIDEQLSTSPTAPKAEAILSIRINDRQLERMTKTMETASNNLRTIIMSAIEQKAQTGEIDVNNLSDVSSMFPQEKIQKMNFDELQRLGFYKEFNNLRIDIALNKQH